MEKIDLFLRAQQKENSKGERKTEKEKKKKVLIIKDDTEKQEMRNVLGKVIATLSYVFFYPSEQVRFGK